MGTEWQPAVTKIYKETAEGWNTLTQYLKQIEVSTISDFLAHEYNMIKDPAHLPIHFIRSHVAELTMTDGSVSHCHLEEELPAGEFIKFKSNNGHWNVDKFDPTLAQFSAYTYRVTGNFMMVTDLQGIKTDDGFHLTDPVILCHDTTRFGSTNLGAPFIDRCLESLKAMLDG